MEVFPQESSWQVRFLRLSRSSTSDLHPRNTEPSWRLLPSRLTG